jgi:hypothetical protein
MVPVCTVNATVPAMWIDAWLGSYYGTGYPSQCGTYYQTETPLTELDVTCLNPIFDVPNPSGPPAYAYYDYGEASFNFICVY